MGAVIITVLAKENLARTTAAVTQLRTEHEIGLLQRQNSLCMEIGFQRSCNGLCGWEWGVGGWRGGGGG